MTLNRAIHLRDSWTSSGPDFAATASLSNPSGFASHTFTGVAIGSPSADRIVWAIMRGDWAAEPPPVQVNGVDMTAGPWVNDATGTLSGFYFNVPTGSTADITIGGTGSDALIVGYIKGLSGGGSAAPNHSGTVVKDNSDSSTPTGPLACTVDTGGIGVIGAGCSFTVTAPTYTWINTLALHGDATAYEITGSNHVDCCASHITASASVSVSNDQNNFAYSSGAMLYMAWAP